MLIYIYFMLKKIVTIVYQHNTTQLRRKTEANFFYTVPFVTTLQKSLWFEPLRVVSKWRFKTLFTVLPPPLVSWDIIYRVSRSKPHTSEVNRRFIDIHKVINVTNLAHAVRFVYYFGNL